MAERYEVFTLGKHFLHVHTEKGFTMYANAKVVNGQLTSYTDKMTRRGGSWVIDAWRFLNKKDFPINPIYTAVFGFDEEDTAVQVNATDIDVESIAGVNGQLVDVGNISLPPEQSLSVNTYAGIEVINIFLEYEKIGTEFQPINFPENLSPSSFFKIEGNCGNTHAGILYMNNTKVYYQDEQLGWTGSEIKWFSDIGQPYIKAFQAAVGFSGSYDIYWKDLKGRYRLTYFKDKKVYIIYC